MDYSEPDTVVDSTIRALREAIRLGRLEPGQRLVVADIAEMLSVSGGPIREAIRRLTGEGLVEIVPHRGASVRKICGAELSDIFELREAVEGLAARLTARYITEDQKTEIRALLAELDRHFDAADGENYLIANQAFHQFIYDVCGNDQVRTLAMRLVFPIYQLRIPHMMLGSGRHTAHLEHHAITAILLTGDEDAAAAAMQRHIRSSGTRLRQTVDQAEVQRPRRQRRRAAV